MIPKIIHQIYWDFSGTNKSIPEKWLESSYSFKKKNPNWDYKLWNKKDAYNLIEQHYNWFLNKWINLSKPIEKVDSFRYILMHHYGGIYADLDTNCIKCLDSLLEENNKVMLCGSNINIPFIKCVNNCSMLSEANHPFWLELLHNINNINIPNFLPEYIRIFCQTGPLMVTYTYNKSNRNDLTILPSHVLDGKQNKEGVFIEHYGNVSWASIDQSDMLKYIIITMGIIIVLLISKMFIKNKMVITNIIFYILVIAIIIGLIILEFKDVEKEENGKNIAPGKPSEKDKISDRLDKISWLSKSDIRLIKWEKIDNFKFYYSFYFRANIV